LVSKNDEFLLEHDSERSKFSKDDMDVNKEFVRYYRNSQTNLLAIEREGNMITIVDFEEGDTLKLFEVRNTVHVLSKTSNYVDMTQLPVGVYVLENDRGDSVVIEKFAESESIMAADY